MKKIIAPLVCSALMCLLFTACTKDVKESQASTEIDAATIALIKAKGFSTDGIKKIEQGYLVEGDIVLSNEDLQTTSTSPNMLIAQEEQYRTNNLVRASSYPVIRVALSNSSSKHQSAFVAALDEAIRRYNAESLTIRFQRVSSSPNITITAYYQENNTLGSAGFPTSGGAPYNQIKMNTYHYSTGTGSTNVNYIATIMAHEMGHCIGFRHTDYMNRAYSCGGASSNEGSSGVGAVHIPGTPTTADSKSWMLACVGSNVNRPFNTNDKTALKYLY
jgi:hypothetical protein